MRPARNFLVIGVALGAGLLAPWTARATDSPLRFTKTFGGSGSDAISVLTTDPSGNVIAAGTTTSFDFQSLTAAEMRPLTSQQARTRAAPGIR